MRIATLLVCLLVLAVSAYAEKAPVQPYDGTPVISDRQGGDTVDAATPINTIPYAASGTTVGMTNLYDAVCPYTGSTAPDVVYSFVACDTGVLAISLCNEGTDYDTKLYVFDANMNELACSDDFCVVGAQSYISEISDENEGGLAVTLGELYYIFVDGYSSASGNYALTITGMDCTTPAEVSTFSTVKSLY